jgi:hypothetical protein
MPSATAVAAKENPARLLKLGHWVGDRFEL